MAQEVYKPGAVVVEEITIIPIESKGNSSQPEESQNNASSILGIAALNSIIKGNFGAALGAATAAILSTIGDETADKPVTDLKRMFTSLNIYESLETPFIMGDITIQDSIDLITTLPITGQGEYMKIRFRVPGTDHNQTIDTGDLIVYKVADRIATGVGGGKIQQYTLHFISKDVLTNLNIAISKTFEKTVSEAIETVLKDFIKTKNDMEIDKTPIKWKFDACNWHPFNYIHRFNKTRGLDKDGRADYVFFMGTNKAKGPKYYFKSLYKLFDQSPQHKIFYKMQNLNKDDQIDYSTSADNIDTFSIGDQGNMLSHSMSGVFGEQILVVDPINKNSNSKTKKIDNKGKSSFNTPLVTASAQLLGKVKYDAATTEKDGYDGTIYDERLRQLASFNNTRLEIPRLAGSEKVQLGKIITFEKPFIHHNIGQIASKLGRVTDPTISDDFLVIRLAHRIFINSGMGEYRYMLSLECVKKELNDVIKTRAV